MATYYRDARDFLQSAELDSATRILLFDWSQQGCAYCKGDLDGYTKVVEEWPGPGRMYIPDAEASIVVSGMCNNRACIPIQFCPFCGRPLTVEALEKLTTLAIKITEYRSDE